MSDVESAMPEADVSKEPDAGSGTGVPAPPEAPRSRSTIRPLRPDVRSVEIEVRTSDRRAIDVTEHVRRSPRRPGATGCCTSSSRMRRPAWR